MLQQYRGLVVQEANKVWRRLPKQTRAWIGLDDMIESGMYFAWKTYKYKWEEGKGASLGTYLKNHLFKFYDNHIIGPYQDAVKRCDKSTVSMNDMESKAQESGRDFQIEKYMLVPTHDHDIDCEVAQCLVKVYNDASPELQQQMVKWFLQSDRTKLHTTGRKFREYKGEFTTLAAKYHVTIATCRHLLTSEVCLDEFSRFTLQIPYNLDNPTPAFPNFFLKFGGMSAEENRERVAAANG